MERLAKAIDPRMAIKFNHISINDNKVVDRLENIGTKTQITINAND